MKKFRINRRSLDEGYYLDAEGDTLGELVASALITFGDWKNWTLWEEPEKLSLAIREIMKVVDASYPEVLTAIAAAMQAQERDAHETFLGAAT